LIDLKIASWHFENENGALLAVASVYPARGDMFRRVFLNDLGSHAIDTQSFVMVWANTTIGSGRFGPKVSWSRDNQHAHDLMIVSVYFSASDLCSTHHPVEVQMAE